MRLNIQPGKLSGNIHAVSSKSQAHRMLICAALSHKPCKIYCPNSSDDIDATVSCLNALGARVIRDGEYFLITPITKVATNAVLDCAESASTLRFLLPLVGALGVTATFILRGRLPMRPLTPLWNEMERMGCTLHRPTENTILCTGKLMPGVYSIDGSLSSQYITGLMIALSIIPGKSRLCLSGSLSSKAYVDMTKDVLSLFGINIVGEDIEGNFPLHGPTELSVEGDWSNAAFFLVANSLGSNIKITNLNPYSLQGDKEIKNLISDIEKVQTINIAQIPDLMPILSVLSAANTGATFINIQRLRLKESDRVHAVQDMLHQMGIHTEETESSFTVYPGVFQSCIVDTYNDHRIAMSAAIAATIATGPVQIVNAECVSKSYPTFWQDFAKLGGIYEQLEG